MATSRNRLARGASLFAIACASAVALTGCIPMPAAPPVPQPHASQPAPPPSPSSDRSEPSGHPEPSDHAESAEPSVAPAGDYQYTVDDGLGDVWAFTPKGVEANPPMESGSAAPGTELYAILIDGNHVEGSASFPIVFEIYLVGPDGTQYSYADTVGLTPEHDIFYAGDTFTGARAVVQVPAGTPATHWRFVSVYGDETIDVQF